MRIATTRKTRSLRLKLVGATSYAHLVNSIYVVFTRIIEYLDLQAKHVASELLLASIYHNSGLLSQAEQIHNTLHTTLLLFPTAKRAKLS